MTFLSELRSKLQISTEPGARYNIPLINALVLYVGTEAINYIHQKGLTPSMSTIAHSSHMDIFQNLAVDLDTEGTWKLLVNYRGEIVIATAVVLVEFYPQFISVIFQAV